MLEVKTIEIEKPVPFLKASFGCSNRQFYEVKQALFDIAEKIDVEYYDGYVSEICDHDGDLEKIIIYNGKREKPFLCAVMKHYNIKDEWLDDMNLVLSIF